MMGVVKDTKKSLDKADEISNKLLSLIEKEFENCKLEDDPAEYMYLMANITGFFLAKSVLTMAGVGEMYAMENFDIAFIKKCLIEVCDIWIKSSPERISN